MNGTVDTPPLRGGHWFFRLLPDAVRLVATVILWSGLALLQLWAVAAVYLDFRIPALRAPFAALYLVTLLCLLIRIGRGKLLAVFACFCVVLAWWLSLKPSNQGNWQQDASRTAYAEIDGDRVALHNVRNCDYRSETEYSHCWGDRTVDLSRLQAMDFFFVNWGVPWIGHPIVSFDFGNNEHLSFSIEARYKVGQQYSAVLGFFRQYALIFVVADERDVVRLRTNYRRDEETYLYRTTVPADVARKLFLIYVAHLNRLKDHPEWYNALTRNCTTAIDSEFRAQLPIPGSWTYRLLLNGSLDELEYERGRLVTDGLPFGELKQRQHINAFAKTVDQSPEFSRLIRQGRVGF